MINFKTVNRFHQSGRSMIEMLGVLAIIGVLSVGGIAGYSKAMMKSKTNSTVETMLTIAANVRTLTLRTKNYDNLEKVAIKMKAVPDKILSADKKSLGINDFGGSIGLGAFYNQSFYISMNGLPKEVCVDIAAKDFGNALIYAGTDNFAASTLDTLKTTKLKLANPQCSSSSPYYCLKKIMPPSTAAQACNCSATGGCSVALIMF